MKRTRGFKLGHRLVRVFRWVLRSRRRSRPRASGLGYQRLGAQNTMMTKICAWGSYLKRGARGLCGSGSGSGSYCRIDQDPEMSPYRDPKPKPIPKGHLAVYVGQKEAGDDPHRVLVPIIYFNHPLFSELLKEAEREFGYNHPGGITIPCPISEFEEVKTRIAAVRKSRKFHRD